MLTRVQQLRIQNKSLKGTSVPHTNYTSKVWHTTHTYASSHLSKQSAWHHTLQLSFVHSIHSTESGSSSNKPKHAAHSSLEISWCCNPSSLLSSLLTSTLRCLLLEPFDALFLFCPPALFSSAFFCFSACLACLSCTSCLFCSSLAAFLSSRSFLFRSFSSCSSLFYVHFLPA